MKQYKQIWYISDLHLGHASIISLEGRPFKNLDVMKEVLTRNICNKIDKHDLLVVVGDLSANIADHNEFAKRILCDKILVYGNHDWEIHKRFSYEKQLWKNIVPILKLKDKGRTVMVSHFPLEVWCGKSHPAYHVHGHTHNLEYTHKIGRFNAFCGLHDWGPTTLNDMIAKQQEEIYLPSRLNEYKPNYAIYNLNSSK